MELVKCPKCGHIIKTKSTLIYISCNSCLSKVKREENKVPEVTTE